MTAGALTEYREQYPHFAVTVDVARFDVRDGELRVLLIRRGVEPHHDAWALPGGFKRPDETLEQAAERELLEETGIPGASTPTLRQFRAYGDPGRDPERERLGVSVVTVAYAGIGAWTASELRAGTDATEVKDWTMADVVNGRVPVAFDHARILREMLDWLRAEIGNSPLATAFLGEAFSLSQLRGVFEAVWGVRLDPGNFHRQFAAEPGRWLVEAGHSITGTPARGRPPALYRRSGRWLAGCPLTNPLLRLGNLLADRRILWLDPHPENNQYAYSYLQTAAAQSNSQGPQIASVETPAKAMAALRRERFDLVISHWGEGAGRGGAPVALQLLRALRDQDLDVPVLVFASERDHLLRRQQALDLGAIDYCYEFDGLFRSMALALDK